MNRAKSLGTLEKFETARSLRAERRSKYVRSTRYAQSKGYRFLTPEELKVWYSRLDKAMEREVERAKANLDKLTAEFERKKAEVETIKQGIESHKGYLQRTKDELERMRAEDKKK